MSFDDRLRDELRRATQSNPIDADAALHDVRENALGDDVVVPLEDVTGPRRRSVRVQRLVGMAAAIALIVGAFAIPLALRDNSDDTAIPKKPLVNRGALQAVASALDATTGAGSFHVEYRLTEQPDAVPNTTTCGTITNSGLYVREGAPGSTVVCAGPQQHGVITTGSATVNTDPFAMVAVSNVSGFGNVTVWVDDTSYWQVTGDNVPPTGAGSPISSSAAVIEATLGPREGIAAIMGLSNPSAYLAISRNAITGAEQTGGGTVDGQAVTTYRVEVDPAQLAEVPGQSHEQRKTILEAVAVLQREGFTGNTTDVSVDARGFIVRTVSVNHFADGGSVTSDNAFSQFGCAGAVKLPGRAIATATGTCSDATTTTGPQSP